FGNCYGPTDDAESRRAVSRAYELGCNFFDSADVYGHGHSEEILGEALAGIRQRVLVATKVGGNFYNRAVNPLLLGRIAEAVGRPVAELAPDVPLPVTHDANFSPDYIRFAVEQSLRRLATDYIDLPQPHNPALGLLAGRYGRDSAWEPGDIRARMPRPYVAQLAAVAERVKELAGQAGVTPAQLALRFVLDNEAVSVVIVGMKTVAQVDENLSLE